MGTTAVARESAPRARGSAVLYGLFSAIAGVVAAVIAAGLLGGSLAALGIPDPGRVTTVGLPLLRGAFWILASLSIGSFLAAAFLFSPRPGWTLTVDALVASRTGAASAFLCAAIGLVMVPLSLSDVSGAPFSVTLNPAAFAAALEQVSAAKIWLLTAGIGVLVAVLGYALRSWSAQPVLLVLSLWLVIPLGMNGHSASGGSHDYGTNSFLWHLVFMALWVGGLMALIAHARRLGPDLPQAVHRYSRLAFLSILVLVVSGLINAAIRMRLEDVLTTPYGRILLAKTIGIVLLGVAGFIHREKTMPQLPDHPRVFIRVAIVEVALMAAVSGLAVTLTRTPPPPPREINLSPMAVQLGYEISEAPSLVVLLTTWRFDIMFGTIALLLAGWYVAGVWRLRRRGERWEGLKTMWWLVGCATLFVTTSSGIGMYMPAMFSVHMIGHMILSAVVPVFLALGSPLSLLHAVTGRGKPGHPTVGDMAYHLSMSPLMRVISHPAVNTLQFIFFFYILYLVIPFYELAISEHAGHLMMNWVFLLSGYLYFWELVGDDPLPHRQPAAARLAWLTGSMTFHLFAGVYLMQLQTVMGEAFYRALNLPFAVDLLHDQKVGGGIGWASMSFPLALVYILLFWWWWRDEHQQGKAYDAAVDSGDDESWEEYNRMLARLNSRGE